MSEQPRSARAKKKAPHHEPAKNNEPPKNPERLVAYNCVAQLWTDLWWSIAGSARRLAIPELDAPVRTELLGSLEEQLSDAEMLAYYHAYPGRQLMAKLRALSMDSCAELSRLAEAIGRNLARDSTPRTDSTPTGDRIDSGDAGAAAAGSDGRPRFEVLLVTDVSPAEEEKLRTELRELRRPEDAFVYELVVVPSFEDAMVAVSINAAIQVVIVRPDFRSRSAIDRSVLSSLLSPVEAEGLDSRSTVQRVTLLADRLRSIRPELDLYLAEQASVEMLATALGSHFDWVFLEQDDVLDLHLTILRGVADRYLTPFFTALTHYARKPVGVFHAMPISRGNSVVNSHWIHDMSDFYGLNIFLAETSATSGGLDSLLDPQGPIKHAQELAARAFGSRRTYFVTNGTSTANKIVTQSLVRPGDTVLLDRNCHKSHHYAQVLAGANVTYLDSYSLDEFSMYGAIGLADIKRTLLTYRSEGRLDEVTMISLTNCTFDGVVYDVERVMTECLAIKPDLVFLWDEAWFAFARFHPVYRRRTAMAAADVLSRRFRTPEYREEYLRRSAELEGKPDDVLASEPLLPDPDKVRVRAYATQSTHKTLTSLRQGSMIHVFDEDFSQRNEAAFHEAYMTHTSTSPNYQILASLDVGRRQVELEGFDLVQRQVELAMTVRDQIAAHPLLSKYFRVLGSSDLIPEQYRPWGSECPLRAGPIAMEEAWGMDEFVLDPCRLNIQICATGIDGTEFKHKHLMDRWGIQVNKTTRNTVLAMTNIGTTRSAVAFLLKALMNIAETVEAELDQMSALNKQVFERQVKSLTTDHPPLPDFSRFHNAFRANPQGTAPDGNMRKAYFMAYDEDQCEYLSPELVRRRVESGQAVVSAIFVTPYPPGFPILVPGQEFSKDILAFMEALDTKEIHGFDHSLGYRVFTDEALAEATAEPAKSPASPTKAVSPPAAPAKGRKKAAGSSRAR